MSSIEKYDAIIIDPDLDSRMRLKQATASVHNFGKVYQLNTLKESIDRLNANEKIDIIFISYRLSEEETKSFIKQGKETPGGQDSAYILVLKPNAQDSSTIAQNIVIGADGFLFEPYSVDVLLEISSLAGKVKKERSTTREKAAIEFLVGDAVNQLDQLAYDKSMQTDVGRTLKKFRETAQAFKTFEGTSLSTYFDAVISKLENAPIPKKIFSKFKYTGASSRLKRRVDARKAMAEGGAAPAQTEEAATEEKKDAKPAAPATPTQNS